MSKSYKNVKNSIQFLLNLFLHLTVLRLCQQVQIEFLLILIVKLFGRKQKIETKFCANDVF